MLEINFKLPFATLIPDFIYQFLSTKYVKKDSIFCFELEDLKDVIIFSKIDGIDEIKKFLSIEPDDYEKYNNFDEAELDAELKEVDSEYYHKYTPGEIRFVFEKIIESIDELHKPFKNYWGLEMSFNIMFIMENIQMNMVVEFLPTNQEPEFIKNAIYLPIKNPLISDDIMARLYFTFNFNYFEKVNDIFNKIINILELREE